MIECEREMYQLICPNQLSTMRGGTSKLKKESLRVVCIITWDCDLGKHKKIFSFEDGGDDDEYVEEGKKDILN